MKCGTLVELPLLAFIAVMMLSEDSSEDEMSVR
jgi:hypothetical protein